MEVVAKDLWVPLSKRLIKWINIDYRQFKTFLQQKYFERLKSKN